MEKSHVQPLLLLLGSLFFLPFLRAVDIVYCNEYTSNRPADAQDVGYDFGTVTSLEVSPDPVGPSDQRITISLSFTTSSTISISPTGTLDVSLIAESMNFLISSNLICTIGECPLEPSKSYSISVSLIRPPIFQNPKYMISLNDRLGDIGQPEKLCVVFDLPT